MLATKGYAANAASKPLEPFSFDRQEIGPNDIQIEIQYCGVCHSDIHQVRDEWGGSIFPMVPGHEVVGKIVKVGDAVTKFKVGETAGIGCFVDSCRTCPSCQAGEEQYCDNHLTFTYNGTYKDGRPTYGGYSDQIVVDEQYALHISDKLPLEGVAPLLCAGITTYSPLKTWNVKAGDKIGVVGLGGLGHMAVKFAASMGAEVTVLSTSPSKKEDAEKLGAHHFIVTKDEEQVKSAAGTFDLIINTISAQHEYDFYLQMLKLDGTMVLVGIPPEAPQVSAFNLISKRRRLAGSMIGGIRETQEMLDYCAEHGIVSDVEVIDIDYINEAYDRMLNNDVRYRFVIDLASLK
ncbi:MAG: NAD(P)-dependent alcohol dehydrogenase [Sphingobacteriaceae bacterium]|nr:MAG: NAD(P)-dependent alcohol dehydrogenase [Sphingobacteriaceae bacterium]